MTRASQQTPTPRSAPRRRARALSAAASVVIVGLLAAGCGGSPSSPNANRQAGQSNAAAQALAYARCMRAHGVPKFPDPTITKSGNGVGIGQGVPAAVGNSPAFKTAQHACAKLAVGGVGGGQPAPITARQRREIVRFASCMRSHGVPNLPDADPTGTFHLDGINSTSPAFTAAVDKCRIQEMPLNFTSRQGSGPQ